MLGKPALAAGGLMLLTMIGLLVAQLAILADSREHIVAQDRKINRIVKGTDPVLNEVEPVAEDARALLRQLTPLARETRPLVREARPLAGEALAVLREFDTGRLFEFVDIGTDLAKGLRDSAFIPRTLLAADLVPVIKGILAETREIQRSTLSTQVRSLRTQRSSRRVQKRTLAILTRSLAVQEQALVHVRSIDRKTGGPAPTAAPAVPAP